MSIRSALIVLVAASCEAFVVSQPRVGSPVTRATAQMGLEQLAKPMGNARHKVTPQLRALFVPD